MTLFVRDVRLEVVYPCPPGVPLVVGRRARNARLDIACDSKHVSRKHCELVATDDGVLRIVDSSAHGTFVNGARVEGEGRAKPGDRVVLGHDYALVVLDDADAGTDAMDAETTAPGALPVRPPAWKSGQLAPETLAGRYRLVRELGRGGMGVVSEAWDEKDGRPCAVKRLAPGLSSPGVVERFRREAMLGARLGGHPSIVAPFDSGSAEGDLYYVMALVDGASLGRRIDEGLDRREGVRLVAETARAVAWAHERGVIHRDLKPANVLVGRDGRPRLVDFGVSKALDEGGGLTATGSLLGTPGYMAPEQVADAKRASPASDVYSLGAVLYCVLTGRPPYEGGDLALILSRVLRGDLVAPRARDASIDAALDDLCRRALSLDPARRPHSAGAFADELDAWLRAASSGRGGAASPAPPTP